MECVCVCPDKDICLKLATVRRDDSAAFLRCRVRAHVSRPGRSARHILRARRPKWNIFRPKVWRSSAKALDSGSATHQNRPKPAPSSVRCARSRCHSLVDMSVVRMCVCVSLEFGKCSRGKKCMKRLYRHICLLRIAHYNAKFVASSLLIVPICFCLVHLPKV